MDRNDPIHVSSKKQSDLIANQAEQTLFKKAVLFLKVLYESSHGFIYKFNLQI